MRIYHKDHRREKIPSQLFCNPDLKNMSADATPEKFVFNACMVNCMSRCPLKIHVQNNNILSVETDNEGQDIYGSHQVRACLRGRSIRKRLESPDRLKYPLKRTGPRGSGRFERVSWNQALESIAERMNQAKQQYGPEAFYINYGTGMIGSVVSKSCPTRALQYGEIEDLKRQTDAAGEVAPLCAAKLTEPSLFLKLHRMAKPVGNTSGKNAAEEEL